VAVRQGTSAWVRRGLLAVVLLGAAVVPGRASSQATARCDGDRCQAAGSILWTRTLPGSWVAQPGVTGTVTSQGQAYAATASGIAVVGFGTTVIGYQARTGKLLWQESLTGVPAGSVVADIRAWPSVVAVGVGPAAGGTGGSEDIVLSAATGRRIRAYPVAAYGGVVAAGLASVVVVSARAVTGYANDSGRVLWRQPTGSAAQRWLVSGRYVYVAQASRGYLSSSPVTAVLRINLRDGVTRVVRPRSRAFAGTLTRVVDGALLFAGADGLWAYSGQTGRFLWHRASAVLELVDTAGKTAYVASATSLVGIAAASGTQTSIGAGAVAASLYAVRDGVALGLDQDALGEAWGYDLASRKVVWTSGSLPWPHFFADLTGLGGSVGTAGNTAVLTICAALGTAPANGLPTPCVRPELAAVLY
jgi:hypothetical protein